MLKPTIKKYDIVQKYVDNKWVDYATIKEDIDVLDAERLLTVSRYYRVISGGPPNWGEVVQWGRKA